jgi:hypothetical protein
MLIYIAYIVFVIVSAALAYLVDFGFAPRP